MSSLTQSIDRLLTSWSKSALLHRHHATSNILAVGDQLGPAYLKVVKCLEWVNFWLVKIWQKPLRYLTQMS